MTPPCHGTRPHAGLRDLKKKRFSRHNGMITVMEVVYVMSKVTIAVYRSDIAECVGEQFIVVVSVVGEVSMLLYVREIISTVLNLLQ